MPGQEDVIIRILTDTKGSAAGVKQSSVAIAKLGKQAELTGRQTYYAGLMIGQMGRAARLAGVAMIAATGGMIKAWSDFQQQMINTQTVARATASEFEELMQTALEMAGTTRFSAEEVAEGMYFLASAGYTATEILEAIGAVADLAAGTLSDFNTTSQYLVTTLAAFNLQAEDSTRVADVFAAAISSTQATLERLGGSFAYIGPVAAEMGVSIEETTAALSAMYDVGILGSKAGRALRMALSKLVDVTPKGTKVLAEFGLSVADINPEFYSLGEILETLRKSGINAAAAFELFGRRAAPAMMTLINLGITGFTEYIEKVSETGRAHELMEEQLNTLQSSMKRMRDSIVAASAELGRSAAGPVKIFVDGVRVLATALENASIGLKTAVILTTSLGGVTIALIGQFGILIGLLVSAQIQYAQLTLAQQAAVAASWNLWKVLKTKVIPAVVSLTGLFAGLALGAAAGLIWLENATHKWLMRSLEAAEAHRKHLAEIRKGAINAARLVDRLSETQAVGMDQMIKRDEELTEARKAMMKTITDYDRENLTKRYTMYMEYVQLTTALRNENTANIKIAAEEMYQWERQLTEMKYYDAEATELRKLELLMLGQRRSIGAMQVELAQYEKFSKEHIKLTAKIIKEKEKLKENELKADIERDKTRAKSYEFFVNAMGGMYTNLVNAAKLTGLDWAISWVTNLHTMFKAAMAFHKALIEIKAAIAAAKMDPLEIARWGIALGLAITAAASAAVQFGAAIESLRGKRTAVAWTPVTLPELEKGEKVPKTVEFQRGGMTKARGMAMLDANEVIMPLEHALAERPGMAPGLGGVTINLNIEGGMFDDDEYWRKITKDRMLPALREIGLEQSSPDVFGYE